MTAAEANQPKTASEIAVSEVRKKELELIKEGYLGKSKAKKKKKLVPPSQKFKFVFDWDIAEDTSTDLNPIYNRKHDISLGFGRGFFAGMDRDEQKKGGSRAYNDLQEKRAQVSTSFPSKLGASTLNTSFIVAVFGVSEGRVGRAPAAGANGCHYREEAAPESALEREKAERDDGPRLADLQRGLQHRVSRWLHATRPAQLAGSEPARLHYDHA